jgi:3-isopropylmalate/(R)-2-methylmalate dehydratase large subunit
MRRRGMNEPQTIIDKLWSAHEIVRRDDGDSLLWVDRHYVHEGSFHAFAKLAERGAKVAEPGLTFGVADHYVPTRGSRHDIANPEIARMVRQVEDNTTKHGIKLFGLDDLRQGIVHVVGPEQGLTLPGLLIVCGDSHTSTHGALGAYAFGIGASEVAHVLMTARQRPVSPAKTSCWRSSLISGWTAPPGARWSSQAPPSARCRSKGG